MKQLATLKRLSICPCGYPTLDDRITIGTTYEIDPSTVRGGFLYKCGGCDREQENILVVDAASVLNPYTSRRPLPLGLFSPSLSD